jgi:hypothetical protein
MEREGQRECREVYNGNTQLCCMYMYSKDLSVDCVSVHPITFLNGVEFGDVVAVSYYRHGLPVLSGTGLWLFIGIIVLTMLAANAFLKARGWHSSSLSALNVGGAGAACG